MAVLVVLLLIIGFNIVEETYKSYGYTQALMRRAANACPYSGKNGGIFGCGAPLWGDE